MNSAINMNSAKKHVILALQILRSQRRKQVGPSEQYTIFFGNQTAATVF